MTSFNSLYSMFFSDDQEEAKDVNNVDYKVLKKDKIEPESHYLQPYDNLDNLGKLLKNRECLKGSLYFNPEEDTKKEYIQQSKSSDKSEIPLIVTYNSSESGTLADAILKLKQQVKDKTD